jgi:hypothetical protein
MATHDEIKPGKLFRHKGGKLYRVMADLNGGPLWGRDRNAEVIWNETRTSGRYPEDRTKVECVQWQINEKYPNGRTYQASRELKIADLTAVD